MKNQISLVEKIEKGKLRRVPIEIGFVDDVGQLNVRTVLAECSYPKKSNRGGFPSHIFLNISSRQIINLHKKWWSEVYKMPTQSPFYKFFSIDEFRLKTDHMENIQQLEGFEPWFVHKIENPRTAFDVAHPFGLFAISTLKYEPKNF
jgi:hypothetical protein